MQNLKWVIAAAGSIFAIGAASAADLPARMYTKAPVADPVYNWTGFYVGGTLGAAWTRDPVNLNVNNNGALVTEFSNIPGSSAFGSRTLSSTVFTASAKAGYNWQVQSWVFGLEADIASLRFRRSTTFTGNPDAPGCAVCLQTHTDNVGADWVATFRPRIGYAVDKWMVYGTGGFAVGNLSFSNTFVDAVPPLFPLGFGAQAAGTGSATLTGWAAGLGTEYAVTKNWLLSFEYMHVDLGKLTVNEQAIRVPLGGPEGNLSFSNRLVSDIVRIGGSYKF